MSPLKSKRQTGVAYNTPLRKFRAHFEGYEVQGRKGQFAKAGQRDVLLNFSKVTVLESDPAYPYNVAQLILKFSDSLNSGWCLFEDSIASVFGKNLNDVSIDDIVKMDVTMEREDNYTFFIDKNGKESKGTVWRVVEAGGRTGGITPMGKALELLEGKSKGEFIGEALADPIVQSDKTLQSIILSGAFFDDQRVKDLYQVENEVYIKKT